MAVRKRWHQDVAPTGLEVWENRVATKIPLLSAFASGYGTTAPKRPAATVREHGGSEGGTELREALVAPSARAESGADRPSLGLVEGQFSRQTLQPDWFWPFTLWRR